MIDQYDRSHKDGKLSFHEFQGVSHAAGGGREGLTPEAGRLERAVDLEPVWNVLLFVHFLS